MRCPRCGAPLGRSDFHGSLILRCSACEAGWFPPGLMKGIADAMIKDGGIPDAEPAFGRAVTAPRDVHDRVLPCPVCARPMDKLNFGYDSNVIIDHCPACDGLWVDDLQLRAIAIYTKGNPAVDRLGRAFVEESGRVEEETQDARLAATMAFNPLALPLGTNVPVARTWWVVGGLIAANAAAFLIEPRHSAAWPLFASRWGLVPAFVASGYNLHGFMTSMFLHAGYLHLIGNMYYLWLFGRNVESALDHWSFFVAYMVSGLCAGAAFALFGYGSTIPMIGASGAISGVLGAYMRLYPDSKVEVWKGPGSSRLYSARFYLWFWFAIQAYGMLKNATLGVVTGVAFVAHIGGFLAGYCFAAAPATAGAETAR